MSGDISEQASLGQRGFTAHSVTDDVEEGTLTHKHQDCDSDSDDGDAGMFSFARPHTGQLEQGNPSFSSSSRNPDSGTNPFASGAFAFGVPPAQRDVSSEPLPDSTQSSTAFSPVLSPAAAYALENNYGPRKRASFSASDSPSYLAQNPYEHSPPREEDYRRNPQSSHDKVEVVESGWADQADFSYAMTPDGQAIMLNEMGEPMRLATSREQKILADLGAAVADYIPYEVEPEYEEEEDSPYPEVRASVSNIDDPEMPVLTFRVWFIGLVFCIIISALNTFFSLRYPAPIVSPIITQILSYPLGKLLARYLPITNFPLPRPLQKIGFADEFSFNPGPFNIKEHTLLVIMANASTAPAYGVSYSLATELYYRVPQAFGSDVMLLLTTQMLGFGVAGVCRRFLVWPASMVWPQNLVYCTLLNTLHAEDEDAGEGTSRFRFFLYAVSAAFAWYFLPGFLFTALSAFSWVCWIAPNNVVVNQLFGVSSGLGMGLFTFDWSQIAYLGSPLIVPWWAEVNIFCGFALAFWIIAPIMYYSNVWESAYLPMSTSQVFDRFGSAYNTSAVIDPVTLALNETAYHEYSPLYLPITYSTVYGITFMLSTAVLVHTLLYNGSSMMSQLRKAKSEDQDVHFKLMKNYPEVPDWWYLLFLAGALGMAIATAAGFETQLPVWALLLSLIIAAVYVVPTGIVFAMTSTQVSINLIVELVAGYVIPGRPIANMLFKTYAVTTVNTGLAFVQDLKLGHYMKLPPRATFTVQVVATSMTSFVQVGVKRWLQREVPDLCSPRQSANLICPGVRVFYSSSIFWGLIGPAREFGPGKMYHPILYWLLAGAVVPVVTYFLMKRWPRTVLQYVNVPVALTGATLMPPATGINFSSWFLVGFIFQYFLRRRRFRWWSKFNFVLSAALDSGTVLSGIFIFLTLSLPKNGTISLNWWGNDVYAKTLDWAGVSYKTPPVEGFGRTSW